MDDGPFDQSDNAASERSPARARTNVRRLVKVLVLVDVVVILAAVGLWLAFRDDPEGNVANDGLRGSRPPAGQAWPDAIRKVDPSFPARADVRGTPSMLVATCADCRSGDIFGGFLGRLAPDALPSDARVVVLTWEGDQAAWAKRWGIDSDRFELHAATTPAGVALARRELGIGPVDGAEESGIAFLHDTDGRWRSTFFLGQLKAADIAHDLEQLAAD